MLVSTGNWKNWVICVFKWKSAKLKISHFSRFFNRKLPSWRLIGASFITCDMFDSFDIKQSQYSVKYLFMKTFRPKKCLFSSILVGVGEAFLLLESFRKQKVYIYWIQWKGYTFNFCIVSYLYVIRHEKCQF